MLRGGHRSARPLNSWHTVTPRLVVRDAKQLVEFLKQVFEATGEYQSERPSVITIGDSMLMVSDAGIRSPMAAFLYVYVSDTDATHRRAVEAGARTLESPFDTPYGDRRCMVEDKWGNTWQIARTNSDRDSANSTWLD
ncbi:MAG: bleomycin resistance protein [Acidobacteria bacterium]|nr:MAG: bleomycin resistance protein [Acidobacteriota bacterium]